MPSATRCTSPYGTELSVLSSIPMKTFILSITLVVLAFIAATPRAHALFSHVAAEKSRREHVEQQLASTQQQLGEQQQIAKDQQRLIGDQQQAVAAEQKLTNKWQTTAFVLGVFSVVLLIVGTAIGSRGRRHATTP